MASLNLDCEASSHRLEGTPEDEPGGLIIMKKHSGLSHMFKKPEGAISKVSLLGLDKLAVLKDPKHINEGGSTPKRSKVMSYKTGDDNDDVEDEKFLNDHKPYIERYC